jgi:hypothetical protein
VLDREIERIELEENREMMFHTEPITKLIWVNADTLYWSKEINTR